MWRNQKAEVLKSLKLPLSIPTRPLKKVLEKSKFFKGKKGSEKEKPKNKPLYAQVLTPKVSKILKIKENFPNLSTKKIENIYKMINNSGKSKPRINITTKGS